MDFVFDYDAHGNRTAKRVATDPNNANNRYYGYNQANRLKSYNNDLYRYTYDGDGLRALKITGNIVSGFTWNVAEGLPQLVEDENITSYITGPSGLPLAQVTYGGAVQYFHQDQLGSTRALTDAAGTVVATFAYDPYGNRTATTGTASTPIGYAGSYTDAESGLHYLQQRYYDPATGQFLSRDPIEELTGQPYAYAWNSPTNFVDPTGLGGEPPTIGRPQGRQEVPTATSPDPGRRPPPGGPIPPCSGRGKWTCRAKGSYAGGQCPFQGQVTGPPVRGSSEAGACRAAKRALARGVRPFGLLLQTCPLHLLKEIRVMPIFRIQVLIEGDTIEELDELSEAIATVVCPAPSHQEHACARRWFISTSELDDREANRWQGLLNE